ncbi:MAG: rod-binding protein [Syntrophaceae bacterium]|jgi:flagellar protein FlgJ
MDSIALQKPSAAAREAGAAGAITAAASGNSREEDKKLRKACAAFESFMVYYMLKTMRKSVPQSGLFGNMAGKDTFNMMLDQKIAEKAAERKGGSLGLQKVLYDQLSAGGRRYGTAGSAAGATASAVNAKI